MSIVTSPYTIPAAIRKAEDVVHPNGVWRVGTNRKWNAVNRQQKQFLEIFEIVRREVGLVSEIKTEASFDAAVLNEFLRSNGFSIQLDPFGVDEFGIVAILKLLMEWLISGEAEDVITPEGKQYPGVLMMNEVPSYNVAGHTNPVISIPTKTQDIVYLTMLGRPTDEFSMITTARHFMTTKKRGRSLEVHFPMVDLDIKVELGWLKEMWTMPQSGPRLKVSQALRQTKVKMNEKGVRIEEAVAIGMVFEAAFVAPKRHVINRPFLMWVERPGLSLPLFVGYISEEDWKNPGSINY